MKTWFMERFGVKIPIACVPKTPPVGGLFAGEVSGAGGFGYQVPSIERFHNVGIQVAEQLQSCALAEAADDAKVDLIVAHGTEKEES